MVRVLGIMFALFIASNVYAEERQVHVLVFGGDSCTFCTRFADQVINKQEFKDFIKDSDIVLWPKKGDVGYLNISRNPDYKVLFDKYRKGFGLGTMIPQTIIVEIFKDGGKTKARKLGNIVGSKSLGETKRIISTAINGLEINTQENK